MTIVLIAGATASGKSGAAIDIAQKTDGVIINADSMQVYRELRVLTARPSPDDEALVEHRLYGTISASERCTVARWLDDVRVEIDSALAAGKTPVIVGGTGLYFKALEFGLAQVPEIPEDIRQTLRQRLVKEGAPVLHEELMRLDEKEAVRFKPGDGQRIVRALEVLLATGKPLGKFHREAEQESILAGRQVEKIVVEIDRDELYQRIDNRFEHMIDDGGLDEVKALRAMQISPDLPAMKAIGVRALGRYLDGHCTLEEAIEKSCQESRNYAKRQLTWIRNQMADWHKTDGSELNLPT